MSDVVKTDEGRKKRLKRYKGLISNLPNITQVVLGDGGRESDGNLKIPTSNQNTLFNELIRVPVSFEDVDDFSTKVVAALDSSIQTNLVGKDINEMGILDSEGTLITIETFGLFDINTGFPPNSQVNIKTQIAME